MPNSLEPIPLAIVSPLVTWCLAVITAWIAQQRGDRNVQRLYEKNVKVMRDHVEFTRSWWQAWNELSVISSTTETKNEAAERLEQTLQTYAIQQYLFATQGSVGERNYLTRVLKWAALDRPRTRAADTLRTLYYVVGSLLLTAGVLNLSLVIGSKAYGIHSIVGILAWLFGPYIALALVLLPLRWAVGAVDNWLTTRNDIKSLTTKAHSPVWRRAVWDLEMRMSDPITYWTANQEFREVVLMVGALISNNYEPTIPEHEARLRVQSARATNPPSSLHGSLIRAAIDLLWDTSTLPRQEPTYASSSTAYGAWLESAPPKPAAESGTLGSGASIESAGDEGATGRPSRGLAIASLTIGIVVIIASFIEYSDLIGIVAGVLGLTLGIIARNRRRSGMSLAGIIISAVGIGLSTLIAPLYLIGAF